MNPILSVICLCYNQKQFLEEAIQSVFSQKGVVFEVIMVDDCSTDDSQNLIRTIAENVDFAHVILHEVNVGNCKSFNEALILAKGKYIIDLSCDDFFSVGAFENQIGFFQNQRDDVGMVFSNALIVNYKGSYIKHHFEIDKIGEAIEHVPSGNLFAEVLKRYFICVPTMVMRKSWLMSLGGYNENLSFEDFDIWVRGSLISKFAYLDKVLISKRIHSYQLSKRMFSYKDGSDYYVSTLRVCEFASNQVVSAEEINSLVIRLRYEGRNAAYYQFPIKKGYRKLLMKLGMWTNYTSFKWGVISMIGYGITLLRNF